ncbi:amino acid adenylation domain-containing protein [Paucibacter sp. APW11]|uniref:Amino acid adenylation domain-containing protein n=1 Tax=Roseateles aquae TaxID=3077235 RepID=A0ABU3P9E2_9BURK|nr:amino acid adenylation domain-containing protein [Paucibacter sp. APW11]MDT8999133.1 amino acid adenylation domain-containing protein [Paucibacter sp. APW11]
MISFRPLNAGQRSLYRHQQFYPGDSAYNLTTLTHIQGPLDVALLEQALQQVLNGADCFKSDFVERDGQPWQRIDTDREVRIQVLHRAAGLSVEAFAEHVQREAEQAQHRVRPPVQWPAVQVSLYLEGEGSAYLLQSIPHLLLDGYGYAFYLDRVARCYRDLRAGGPAAAESSSWVDAQSDARSRAFYDAELAGRQALELESIAQPRDSVGALRGRMHEFQLPRAPLDAWMQAQGFNPTRLFLAVYALLLQRLVPETAPVIGYAVPARSAANRQAIGCFVNTVPLLLDVAGCDRLPELARQIDQKLFRLHRYQDFDPDQWPGLAPRMNCLFTLYAQELRLSLEGCQTRALSIAREHLVAELRLTVEVRAEAYHFALDLGRFFSELDVGAAYRALLDGLMQTPDAALESLPLEASVMIDLPAQQALAQRIEGLSLAAAFERVVGRHGQRTALRWQGSDWSYQQLDSLANQMARLLQREAEAEPCIVVALERGPWAVALMLAVIKLNKCYVPLDPRSPLDRLQMMVEDLGQAYVISEGLTGSWNGMTLEQLRTGCAALPNLPLGLPAEPEAEAYIIYTSGSTGRPKGAVLSQSNLLSRILACGKDFAFGPDDVWTLFHSFNFDYSIWEMFACLLHGGKLVLVDHLSSRDPASLYRLLHEEGVSIMNHTPSEFKGLVAEDQRQGGRLRPRWLFLGGEALNFNSLRDWVAQHPLQHCPIVNLYGPTEATVLSTWHRLREQDLNGRRSIIGQAIAGAAIYLLRPDGQLALQGTPGEIVVAGLGVGEGYLRRPEETAARFINTPSGAGFRTGDLGRIAADGQLDFLGRLDRQLKVRGYRIEPAEVEAALQASGLIECCAVGVQQLPGSSDAALVALVVPSSAACSESLLRETLRQTLPAYMVPSRIGLCQQLPVTLSGKIDFAGLAAASAVEAQALKGQNETERWLFGLVAHKLGSAQFQPHEHLLDIGITSLDLVDLVVQINEGRGEGSVSVSDVFEHPSVVALARFLDQGRALPESQGQGEQRANRRLALAAEAISPRARNTSLAGERG